MDTASGIIVQRFNFSLNTSFIARSGDNRHVYLPVLRIAQTASIAIQDVESRGNNGDLPHSSAVSANGSELYAPAATGGLLQVNTATLASRVIAAASPYQMVASNDGRLYVNFTNSIGKVVVLNTGNNSVVRQIAISNFISDMAVDDSMHRLYVLSINSKDQRQFTAIDTASWSMIKNIVFNATSNTPGPPLAVDPVSHDIFACAGTPQRISAATFTVQTYRVDPRPHALSCVATP